MRGETRLHGFRQRRQRTRTDGARFGPNSVAAAAATQQIETDATALRRRLRFRVDAS